MAESEPEPEPELISKLWRELESMTFAASVEALDGSKMPVCLACKQNALPDMWYVSAKEQWQITKQLMPICSRARVELTVTVLPSRVLPMP